MKRKKNNIPISLFPFVSVLLCIIGVLALITVAMPIAQEKEISQPMQQIQFQWVGAPEYVKPFFIRCFKGELIFDNVLLGTTQKITFEELIKEVKTPSVFFSYLKQIQLQNQAFRQKASDIEYYPMLLVYPESAMTVETLAWFLEQAGIQNIGLEPMLKEWEVPYYQN